MAIRECLLVAVFKQVPTSFAETVALRLPFIPVCRFSEHVHHGGSKNHKLAAVEP